ncbi:MAG: ABC transporter permease [Chloroflexi bacterium]|nr:ABC transporter permease [Chloroflexota bacterium]
MCATPEGVAITAYLVRRLIHSVLVLAGVLIFVFVLGRGIGDPAKMMLAPDASQEQYLATRAQYGFDDPLYVQFGRTAAGWLHGDFGQSLWQRVPSLPVALSRVPATLHLALATALIAIPTAILIGTVSAIYPRSIIDRVLTVVSLGGVSTAEFWLGLMLILLFAVQLGWLPTSGYGGLEHTLLPALTLAFRPIGRIAQVARGAMLDEMSKPYVVTARSKGLTERVCTFGHAFRNAAIPIVTMSGDETASLLNGAVVVETVFGWAGIGSLLIQSIGRRDLPLVEATVFVIAIMIIALNLLVDILYTRVDPRIRFGSSAA